MINYIVGAVYKSYFIQVIIYSSILFILSRSKLFVQKAYQFPRKLRFF